MEFSSCLLEVVIVCSFANVFVRAAGQVLELNPGTFAQQLKGLKDRQRLLVDLTPSSWFLDAFEDAASRAGTGGTEFTWARLDCNRHMDMCDSQLGAEVWTGLRLYHAGSSRRGHVEIPTAAFTADTESNVQKLVALVELDAGKRSAEILAQEWEDHARNVEREAAELRESTYFETGVTVVTDSTFKQVLGRVHDEPGHQVFLLYHGSMRDCAEERQQMTKAYRALSTAQQSKVTMATVNCDLHRRPCEAASLAMYCIAGHHVKSNTCPQTHGPRGQAVYTGRMVEEDILHAIESRLPPTIAESPRLAAPTVNAEL